MAGEGGRSRSCAARPILRTAMCMGLATGLPSAAGHLSPRAVFARVKAATGGEAWDRVITLRCTGDLEANGFNGTQTTLEQARTGAWLQRYELGLLSSAAGFDGREAWTQDRSGRSLPDRSEAGRRSVVNSAYAACKALLFPGRWAARLGPVRVRKEAGRAYYVVDVEPRGGCRFSVWVDVRTWLPGMVVSSHNGLPETVLMEDYREVDGLKLPFQVRSKRGNEFQSAWRCTRVEVNPEVDPRMFARPASPPPDFGLDGDAVQVRVPMAPAQGSQIFLRTHLNGHGPYWFCLDSGCSMSGLTPRVAAEAQLIPAGQAREDGIGPSRGGIRFCVVDHLQIGAARMDNQVFTVSAGLEVIGTIQGEPCAGLLGSELFQRFVVRLDYGRGEVGLVLPEAFRSPGRVAGTPIAFWQGIPQAEGCLDGRKGTVNLDTGSGETLDVFSPFVRKHNLVRRSGRLILDPDSVGIGGGTMSYAVRARELRVGNAVLPRPIVSLAVSKNGAFSWMEGLGNLGSGFMERFNVTFDYSRERVFFEPNARHGEPDRFRNRHGIQALQERPGGFRIGRVIPGSPAALAGFKAGDLIVGIPGKEVPGLTMDQLREYLKAPAGRAVELQKKRGKRQFRATLVLRDLL